MSSRFEESPGIVKPFSPAGLPMLAVRRVADLPLLPLPAAVTPGMVERLPTVGGMVVRNDGRVRRRARLRSPVGWLLLIKSKAESGGGPATPEVAARVIGRPWVMRFEAGVGTLAMV